MKIYGPYIRKDGRKHICILHDDGKRQTKSYPRYVMEQYLGRELTKEETVDHINNDFTDDRIDNLQLLSLRDNVLKSKIGKEAIMYSFSCLCCGKEAVRELYKVERNWKLGRSGPYCGKQCAGKATYVNPWVTK